MFTPPHSINLKDIEMAQVRLGIQGYPGVGKTTSGLTAPNVSVADFDNKLGSHIGKDVPVFKFHDPEYLFKEFSLKSDKGLVGHLGFLTWLKKYGEKFEPNQTLLIDSLSSIINSFDNWWDKNPQTVKSGGYDSYAPHKAKIAYMAELVTWLKYLKCHVIMTVHETVERDEEGRLTGKVRPLLSGQFGDQIGGHFTDWFRQVAIPRVNQQRNEPNTVNGKKLENDVNYFWQTQTDSICNCCTSLPDVKVKFTKPDFNWVFKERKYNEI